MQILQTPEPFNKEGLNSLGKLLLNSWSAEYALRLTPILNDDNYLKRSLNWTFPQVYYAGLFSARALLLTRGQAVSNEAVVSLEMGLLAANGFYGPDFTALNNPYYDLGQYRIVDKDSDPVKRSLSGLDMKAFHQGLIDKANALALIHEGYIMDRIGSDAYGLIIDQIPFYLLDSVLGQRFEQLTTGNVKTLLP